MTPHEAFERIRRYDGQLHAFVRLFDPPLAAPDASGPVFAIKDMIDVAGAPTGGGARTPLDPSPERHATCVAQLLAAGWIGVGKTQTVELAFGAWGTNRAVGSPCNPWDARTPRVTGGSSSGSGAAVAAGLCDAALGTDTAGSVRIPAATCGVVGLKPGRGLVSLAGVHPLSPTLDTVGVLAGTVEMAARMLAACAGGDEAGTWRRFDADAALVGNALGLKLAACPADAIPDLHPEVRRLYLGALDRLRETGATVEMVAPPKSSEASFRANGVIMAGEAWRTRRDRIASVGQLMDPWIVRRFQSGQALSDAQIAEAHARRSQDQTDFALWMRNYDVVVTPTCPLPAAPLSAIDEAASPLSRLTREANYLDLPAISVPCGLTRNGLPVGLQLVGRTGEEATVVSLAQAFEGVSGWGGRRPDLSGFAN